MAPESSPVAKRRRIQNNGVFAEFQNKPTVLGQIDRAALNTDLKGRTVFWKTPKLDFWEFGVIKDNYSLVDRRGEGVPYDSKLCFLIDELPKDLKFYTRNDRKVTRVVEWILRRNTRVEAKGFDLAAMREEDGSKVAGLRGKDIFLDDQEIAHLKEKGWAKAIGTMLHTTATGYPNFRMTETKKKMVAKRSLQRRLDSRFTAVGTERVYVTVQRELSIVNN